MTALLLALLVPCSLLHQTTMLPPVPPPASVVIIQSDAQVAFYISFTSTQNTTTQLHPEVSRVLNDHGWQNLMVVGTKFYLLGDRLISLVHWLRVVKRSIEHTAITPTLHYGHHRHLRYRNLAVNDKQINTLVSCPVYNTILSANPQSSDSQHCSCYCLSASAWQHYVSVSHLWHRCVTCVIIV